MVQLDIHGRVIESISWLHLGIIRYFDYLLENKFIQKSIHDNLIKLVFDILINIALSQSELIKEDKPTEIFINKLNALIESEQVYFQNINNQLNKNTGDLIGFEDDEYYYLNFDIAHKNVKKICSEQGEHFSLSSKSLLKQLADEKLIISENGINTFTKRINKKVFKLTWLHKSALTTL